jgi:hypothetical protein
MKLRLGLSDIVRSITVLRSSSIVILKASIPKTDLIFNGKILSGIQIIDFYNIQSNHSLIALPSELRPADAARSLQIIHDLDTFTDFIQSIVNQISREEFVRLQDPR